MDVFMIIQFLFDAGLLFAIFFLFHYSVNQGQKKREEWDLLKNMQIQEMKENLQELLLTLKQLGKEVSDNIQEQVRVAEDKTELFKKVLSKLQKDLKKTLELAEEVNGEKKHLEEKMGVIQMAKKTFPKVRPADLSSKTSKQFSGKIFSKTKENETGEMVGFSSGIIKEVYRLADEEHELNEIVKRTQLSHAEVQLILNLRGNRFTTPN
jgi:hypothetical protein